MKPIRRVLWVTVASVALGVAGVAGLAVWSGTRPGPYRVMFDAVTLDMPAKDVERLVPPTPAEREEGDAVESLDWVGRIDGEARHVRVGVAEIGRHPVLAKSQLYGLQGQGYEEHKLPNGAVEYRSWTGEVVATERTWASDREQLIVLFDQGVVAEKAYYRLGPGRTWWDAIRDFIEDRRPF